jgi:transposase
MNMTKSRVIKRMPTSASRDGSAKLWHDESVLRKLYEQDGRTQKEIATELGCSMLTINKAFKKFGIKATRGRRPGKPNTLRRAPSSTTQPFVRIAAAGLSPQEVRRRFVELTEIMERLGPHAREAVKKDLHALVDRL